MTELKYHSATSNLDSNHQWWVTLQKGTELDIMCLLIDSHITPYDILMTKKKKKSQLNLIKHLDLTTNFQETVK